MSRIDELYARYRKPLVAELEKFGLSEDDAKDVAQETLIATWKRLDDFAPDSEWVYLKVAAINNARKRFTRAKAVRRGGGLLKPLGEKDDAEDGRPIAESELIERQEIAQFRARFNAAVNELGADTQQCLALRRRGLGSKEIAQTLGLSDQAVRTRLSRAMAILRERVGEPPDVKWAELGDDDDHAH